MANKKIKVALDSGHGLYTAGKRCMKRLDSNETREWILNDRVTDEVARLLLSTGNYEIMRVDDTDGSTDISLPSRVSKANRWKADFYMSIHHNSGVKGSSGGGTEVYVSKGASAKSKATQKAIYNGVIKHAGLKGNRQSPMRSTDFYVIRYTNMPACLIECGFMDSKNDIQYILNPEWSKKIARGIAEGICEVFGGSIGAKPVATPSTSAPSKSNKIVVDGSFGGATVRATQIVLGTVVDGIVSRQPKSNQKYLTAIYAPAWQFKRTAYSGGSGMVKAIQRLVGVKDDGFMGKGTITAMQKFLNNKGYKCGDCDGIMGKNTVAAWQRYINSRLK